MKVFSTPDPWAELRRQPHLRLAWVELPFPYRACTDGTTIWLDTRLTQRERRCALMHELIHIEMGHTSHQPASIEKQVEIVTAERLLPDIEIIAENLADVDIATAAEALWVTPSVLQTRLTALTAIESAELSRLLPAQL